MLIREGLLIEYAPGHLIESDMAEYAGLRGHALAGLLPRAYTAITYSALWVHTGIILGSPTLSASHPTTSMPHNHSRRTIADSCTQMIGGLRLTNPACTATDFLLLAPKDAPQAIRLLGEHTGLSLDAIAAHLYGAEAERRPRAPARRLLAHLQSQA